MLPPR